MIKYKTREKKLKLYNVRDLEGFFNAVDKCNGSVELVTDEGDRLNLKSNLCKYISFAEIFSGGDVIPEMDIVCSNKEDVSTLMNFMINEVR